MDTEVKKTTFDEIAAENEAKKRKLEAERLEANKQVLRAYKISGSETKNNQRSGSIDKTKKSDTNSEFGKRKPEAPLLSKAPEGKLVFLSSKIKPESSVVEKNVVPFSLPSGAVKSLASTDYGLLYAVVEDNKTKVKNHVKSFDKGRNWEKESLVGDNQALIRSNLGTIATFSQKQSGGGVIDVRFDRALLTLQLGIETQGLDCRGIDLLPFGGAVFVKDRNVYYAKINPADKNSLLSVPFPIMTLSEGVGEIVDVQFVREWSARYDDVTSSSKSQNRQEGYSQESLPLLVRRIRDYHQNSYARPYIYLWTKSGLSIYDIIDNAIQASSLSRIIPGKIVAVPDVQPNGKIMFVTDESGFYVSSNKAATWAISKSGLLKGAIKRIRVNGKYIVLLVENKDGGSDVIYSDHSANDWRKINLNKSTHLVTDISLGAGGELYLGMAAGILAVDLVRGVSRPISSANTGRFGSKT